MGAHAPNYGPGEQAVQQVFYPATHLMAAQHDSNTIMPTVDGPL